MKKIILLLTFCSLLQPVSFAQKAVTGYLEGGLSLHAAWKDGSTGAYLPSFTLGPGVKFIGKGDVSIILDIPCSAGWNLKKGTYFGIHVPLMLNFQFGSASANKGNSKFGFILGAGAGYTNIANYYEYSSTQRAHKEFWGYHLRAGLSFDRSDESFSGPMLVFNFGKSISPGNGYIAGISLLVGGTIGKN